MCMYVCGCLLHVIFWCKQIAPGPPGDGLTAFDIAKRGGGMGNTVIRAAPN